MLVRDSVTVELTPSDLTKGRMSFAIRTNAPRLGRQETVHAARGSNATRDGDRRTEVFARPVARPPRHIHREAASREGAWRSP
jgi:hypothetical protein